MAVSELARGAVIASRYRLELVLGEGGMGVVWAAEELATGQRVAIKLLKDDVDDPDARRRFAHEARAAAAVRHPNVVRILGVIELADERPAIVMERLEGETLREVLARRERLPLAELARLLAPVIAAVGAAHELGIVHRDLKPENIFLARGEAGDAGDVTVKILDFGIAKLTALDGETMRTTGLTTGKVLGTPAYMAPEQVYGQTDLDHRVDVWALGLIFYQALSGILPTHGDNIGQVFRNVTARPFAPLAQLVPGTPAGLSALVARMLARERAERPEDLREVYAAIVRSTTPAEAVPSEDEDEDENEEAFSGAPRPPFGPPAAALRALAAAAAGRDEAATALARTQPAGSSTSLFSTGSTGSTGAAEPALQTSPAGHFPPMPTTAMERPRLFTRRRATLAVAALAAAAAALVTYRLVGAPPAAPAAASPLAAATAVLACPILRASGVDEPAGWLGAAAAAVACERGRVLLGGRPERTLAPAELLDLPRGPADRFPDDPYGAPDARDRALAAAGQRAQAYLDGEVAVSSAGFAVSLTLHRPDGGELGHATGRGRSLAEAVRAAMTPLIRAELLPPAAALDPEVAAWARTSDPSIALAVVDLTFAFAHNAGGLPDECRRFAALGERPGELGLEGRTMCEYVLGRPAPKREADRVERPAVPASSDLAATIATRIRLDYLLHRNAPPGAADRLHALLASEPTPRGRGQLAASESCLRGATDPRAARELAIVAVQSEPKNPEGGWCNPWEQLMTLERDTPGAGAALRAMQAWVPWNSYAWLEAGFGSNARAAAALPMVRRAYTLSPFDAQVADTLASSALATGDRSTARGIALALRGGGLPLHQVASDLLLMRVESSEARFGAALERALRGSQLSGEDAGWVHAQRFEMAWRALELAVLLGRGQAVADQLIARFLTPEPPPLDGRFASVPMRVPAICALASAPARCFTRYRALRPQLPGAITEDTDAFLLGAERYVQRDLPGAARAWRPLLGGKMALALALPDAMAEVFSAPGTTFAPELAARIDAEVMKRAGELHGATLGHVRAAQRAAAAGDRVLARQLGEQVIAAWALADEPPPALAQVRKLLARLR